MQHRGRSAWLGDQRCQQQRPAEGVPLLAGGRLQPRVLLQRVRWHGFLLHGVRRRLPGGVQGRHRVPFPATVAVAAAAQPVAAVTVAAVTVAAAAQPVATLAVAAVAQPAAAVAVAAVTVAAVTVAASGTAVAAAVSAVAVDPRSRRSLQRP